MASVGAEFAYLGLTHHVILSDQRDHPKGMGINEKSPKRLNLTEILGILHFVQNDIIWTYFTKTLAHSASTLPLDGAIRIELQQGIPIFRASISIQERIETLLHKQRETKLSLAEVEELDLYEEIDDYLSFINRIVRNLTKNHNQLSEHGSMA